MLFATIQELELQGVFCKEASQILFRNTVFTRALDFPRKSRQAAIKFCKDYVNAKLICLLVESQDYLTVWIETQEDFSLREKEGNENKFEEFKLSSSSFKTEYSSNESVHSEFIDRGSIENTSSPYYKHLKDERLADSQQTNEIIHKVPLPPQDNLCPENNDSHLSSLNVDLSPKKRRKRQYRGISY
jgi:hypothetical protein